MAPFGGFDMPIQYTGIIAEHQSTRTAATVFDTCHMGEFRITGPSACRDLESLLSSSVADMDIGQCRYGFLCSPEGGVIDDEITYRLADDAFFMVVNAGTQDGDFAWISKHLSADTSIENLSADTAKLDLQGPASPPIMQSLLEQPLTGLKYYRFMHNRYRGTDVIVSRTGYTGEIGFEVYCPAEMAGQLWDDILAGGATPAGLGARDTLRLEMGFPLYGHELNDTRNAAESGFMRSIAADKEFVGSNIVLDESRRRDLLVGLSLDGRRAARDGDTVQDTAGTPVGTITSGSFSPTLGCSIALAYVRADLGNPATELMVKTARAELKAEVAELPFYRDATGRKALSRFLSHA